MISLGTCLIDGTLPFIFYYIESLNPSGPSPEKLCFEGRSLVMIPSTLPTLMFFFLKSINL